MSPSSMGPTGMSRNNGYNSSSSCSSEDGDHHHHQYQHPQIPSPSTSPTTPTTIQLHPPEKIYSNVLLSDFLEKPIDDLVGDLLQDNVSKML